VATRIADDPGLLELQCALGDPFATHAQHVGNQLLRDDQFVALQTIQTQEKPSAKLLAERVVTVPRRPCELGTAKLESHAAFNKKSTWMAS
jgi:hypothetical protein